MADLAISNRDETRADGTDYRMRALRAFGFDDRIFHALTLSAAILVLVLLGAIIGSLIIGSAPAWQKFGFNFFITDRWSVNREIFGAVAPIYGTVVSSIIALIIAVPVGLGIAIFLTELCPQALRRPIGIAIELLAGIPSIIYGIWGFFVLAPFLQHYVFPWISAACENIPVLNILFEPSPSGSSLLAASLVLAIMVLPFITAIARDVFLTVPAVLKESAYGLGCTTWEVVKNVVIPYTRVGVVGGVMLALGRALGETMAVTFVIGNSHNISASLLAPATTISATIANEFAEAQGMYSSALLALGLMLFVITFIVLAISRIMLRQLELKAGK